MGVKFFYGKLRNTVTGQKLLWGLRGPPPVPRGLKDLKDRNACVGLTGIKLELSDNGKP